MLQVALFACSSDGASTAVPTIATVSAVAVTATSTPVPTATLPPPSDLSRGGILRIAIQEAPPHQDVHQSVSPVLSTWGAGLAYSRLLKYQSGLGVPLPSRIPECDLCTSWKQTGPLEFEFAIRDDAFWPDIAPVNGRRVTAQDIAYSYRRQMTEGWPNDELLSNIQEVAAYDENRLRIRLYAPDSEFFEKLANGHNTVVAPEVVRINGDLVNGPTLGSGPWVLEEISGGAATFETNRDYYGDSVPYLDGMSVQFIPQASTRATGVRAGVLDLVETNIAEVNSAIERFPEFQSISVEQPGTGVEVAFNTSVEPLNSLEVRQALFLGWDLENMLSEVWGGELAPSVGLNLPHPDWMADFGANYGDMFGDKEAANNLLNTVGLEPTRRLQIFAGEFGETQEDDSYVRTADSLASSISALGISVEVIRVPTRLFADNVWLRGEYDLFVGAPPPVSSLSGQLFGIYHSDGPWNTTGYSTSELDRLIEEQALETDFAERGRLLLEIQDEIMAGAHRFYPGTGVSHWLWQPMVQDVYPDTMGASADFLTQVWLKR